MIGMAHLELHTLVTPIIGKLRYHIQNLMDYEEFYIMPLNGCDVLLGMHWVHHMDADIKGHIIVTHRGKKRRPLG